MKSSTGKFILIGCTGIALIVLFAAGGILWLFLGAVESVNNNLSGGYKISGGKVNFYKPASGFTTWQSWEIKEADAQTFEILEDGYAKDKNHAYVDGFILPQSDGETFKIIRKPYAADQNRVFYEQFLLSNSPEKFRVVGGDYSADDEKVFSGRNEFLNGTVDARTFERAGSSDFFKDKNHVYMNEKIVEGADSATFEKITEPKVSNANAKDFYYAKDARSVFYNGVKVAGCDPKTHKIIDFQTHRDAKHLFLQTEKISDDPDNFEELDADYSKDSRNVYWKSKKIGADPATFQVFADTVSVAAFAKDAKNVYWCAFKLERADAATFVWLKGSYGKDKNNVWYGQYLTEPAIIVENADVATFEVYDESGDKARDKNSYFEWGKFKSAREQQ